MLSLFLESIPLLIGKGNKCFSKLSSILSFVGILCIEKDSSSDGQYSIPLLKIVQRTFLKLNVKPLHGYLSTHWIFLYVAKDDLFMLDNAVSS